MYAENPSKGFMPSPGSIASWRIPPGAVAFTHHGDVRVDSGVQQGDQVFLSAIQPSSAQFETHHFREAQHVSSQLF